MIQTLFNFITQNIFIIIYLFALCEILLIVYMHLQMKKHENVLGDVCDNLLKGLSDSPDKDSEQTTTERIHVVLEYIKNKLAQGSEFRDQIAQNSKGVIQRPLYSRHYKIEMCSSVISTLVQIFPLLGILGTILAIAQTAFQNGGNIDVSSLSNAFVLAMDTTILGITFSILFMVVESILQPRVERVINESVNYKRIVTDINMVNNANV